VWQDVADTTSSLSGPFTRLSRFSHFYSFQIPPYQYLLQRNDLTPLSSLPNSIPPHEIQQRLADLICRFVTPINVKIINDKMGNKAAFVQTKVGGLHILASLSDSTPTVQ
jgi:hypothetical protein